MTLSSSEAEYVAISEVCSDIMYLKQVLEFLGLTIKLPITVYCDNLGAIFMTKNEVTQRTKHVSTRYHYVREFVEDGVVQVIFCRSENNLSDPYTKNVRGEVLKEHVKSYVVEWEFEKEGC